MDHEALGVPGNIYAETCQEIKKNDGNKEINNNSRIWRLRTVHI